MKKIILFTAFLSIGFCMNAQDLPENPEPGKCYVRCKTPDVWKNEDITVETKSAYKKIIVHPAESENVTEEVLVKEATYKIEIIPAVYEIQDVEVVIKEASYKLEVIPTSYDIETVGYASKELGATLKVIPASFKSTSETIEVKPKTAIWQMSDKAPDCESSDPNDCRYWCYKSVPAEFVTINQTQVAADAFTEKISDSDMNDRSYKNYRISKESTTRKIEIPAVTKTIKKKVMVSPPKERKIEIPAKYETINRVMVVKKAREEVITVPAEHKTISKEILITKGGLTTWKEVDCKLVEYNPLPIKWNFGSAQLTDEAKSLIDTRLLPIFQQDVAVELASHTDSRGGKESNQNLSERRAQAVANYLMTKGINSSQLVAKGYGEARLTNRCSDGVSCTEKEHQVNRRTEFRIINQ